MAINGYTDKMSVQPGQKVKFMVNCESGNYKTQIVRLLHGDTHPDSPGFKYENINADVNREYRGRKQEIHMGSYIKVEDQLPLKEIESFSLQAMIFPTTAKNGEQAILSKWNPENDSGFGLFIDNGGYLSLWIGDKSGIIQKVTMDKQLVDGCWFFVGASFDAKTGETSIFQDAIITKTNGRFSNTYNIENMTGEQKQKIDIKPQADNGAMFVMASVVREDVNQKLIPSYRYNGKIDRPRLYNKALSKAQMTKQLDNPSSEAIVGAWNFSKGITKKGIKELEKIYDESPNGLHGEAINMPMRGATGFNWTAEEMNYAHAPEQYGAIHFHDDDLIDANWDVDFEWQIPESLPSGVYAAHVHDGEQEDYIVFFVRPKKGQATAKTVVILPTASYLAYANNRFQDIPVAQLMFGRAPVVQREDMYLGEHAEYGLSTYDHHFDGTGVCYSSSLRPILNMRPLYRHNLSPSLWQFNADLHLIDWLTEMKYDFDVITDQDLHLEGADLLNQYKVAMTGSHPEYYSGNMLDGIEDFQASGGRFMYMASNGFYWIVNFHPDNPSIMEVRKEFGNGAWKTLPGENHLSFSGEFGTIWKHRNRAPQKIAGTGYAAQGFEVSSYYRRTDESYGENLEWMFKGTEKEEILGDFGLVGGGAAGLEVDIADYALGTVPHATIVASSEDHSSVYMPVAEELYFNIPGLAGDENPRVRADMVYYPTPNGGAVFSTSSIAFCGSLSHNNYDNNISRLTANVLNRFLSDKPLG